MFGSRMQDQSVWAYSRLLIETKGSGPCFCQQDRLEHCSDGHLSRPLAIGSSRGHGSPGRVLFPLGSIISMEKSESQSGNLELSMYVMYEA